MKKFITAVLIVTLTAAGLTACGKAKEAPAEPEKAQQTEAAPAEEPQALTPEESEAETDADVAVFERFLGGETEATLAYDSLEDITSACMSYEEFDGEYQKIALWNGAERLSFEELTGLVKSTPDLDTSHVEVYSSIISTSGGRALVVKYEHIGIEYAEDDTSCAYFIFTAEGEKLNLVYAGDSFTRKYLEIFSGGLICGDGSNGAGDHIEWKSAVNAEGGIDEIYRLNTLNDSWVADFTGDEDYASHEGYQGLTLVVLNAGYDYYYSYEAADTVKKDKLEAVLKYAEAQGMKKLDDAYKKADELLEKHAVSAIEQNEITDWKPIALSSEAQGQGKRIMPVSETMNARKAQDNMPDGGYDVGIDVDGIREENGEIIIPMEFYNYDIYSPKDIESLEKGDIIVVCGEDIRVSSIGKNAGSCEINGGFEMDGVSLMEMEDGLYRTWIENDYPMYYNIGSANIRASKDCFFWDTGWSSEPSAEQKEYRGADLVKGLKAGSAAGYYPGNTSVVITDGRVTSISRNWTP